jgi:glycogen synthase
MRVSLVTPEYPPDSPAGGIGTNTQTLARALARRGTAVQVVTYGRVGSGLEEDFPVNRVRPPALRRGRLRTVVARRDLSSHVSRFRPDVVHAAEWGAAAWWIARFRSVPVVTRLATPGFLARRINGSAPLPGDGRIEWMERDQTRRSALVYGPTRAIADEVARCWSLERSKIRLVPNALDVRSVREAGARDPGVPLPTRFIVFFGRLERRKGVQVLLEALPIVLSAHPSVHVVLIGGDMGGDAGADALNVAPLVSALGDRVMRLGELPRDQALAIVARAELAIVPSLW